MTDITTKTSQELYDAEMITDKELAASVTFADDADDFDSPDFEEIEDRTDGYLDRMWNAQGFGARDAQAAVVAHGMVQTFVNAFARDGRYDVSFDASVETAGTDLNARRVVITPAPILDTNITVEEAGRVLTGMAVHEISHPRYGRRTAQAVNKAFPRNRIAAALSNVLDDVRIERRFVADYPGYADVFEPTLTYVAEAGIRKYGVNEPAMDALVNLATSAIRYDRFARWTDATQTERLWWQAWADRWAVEDAPKRHVDAIRVALQHIKDLREEAKAEAPPAPQTESPQADNDDPASDEGESRPQIDDELENEELQMGQDNADVSSDPADDTEDTESDEAPEADEDATDESGEAQDSSSDAPAVDDDTVTADDADLNESTADEDTTSSLPECNGENAVEDAADADQQEIEELRRESEAAVETARSLEESRYGDKVDVAKSLKGLINGPDRARPSSQAVRYVRNAFAASRTGNTAVDNYRKSGRLENRGLTRIAYGDTRLFERRRAPSPGKYNIWLLVDCSGSMGGRQLMDASSVAHAIATASSDVPSMRAAVWGWSNPFRYGFVSAPTGVVKTWQTGQKTDAILRLPGVMLGGTPDAQAFGWAIDAIRRDSKDGETPVIIMISDGYGSRDLMKQRVADAAKAGVTVKSVSFGRAVDADSQEKIYGRGNFVTWAGSIMATAKPMARMIADIVKIK